VTSNFSGEGNVTYEYGGDGKRRKRQDSSATRQYNWDAGWNVISEENGCGTLTMTYVHDPGKVIGTILADVDSDDPSTGRYRYYFQDNIGSTRRLRNDAKASLGSYEYTPYGQVYLQSGATIRHKFTGQEWDDMAALYYFPYRDYSPSVARWITRDPGGNVDGVNLYVYAQCQPIGRFDRLGFYSIHSSCNYMCNYVDLGPTANISRRSIGVAIRRVVARADHCLPGAVARCVKRKLSPASNYRITCADSWTCRMQPKLYAFVPKIGGATHMNICRTNFSSANIAWLPGLIAHEMLHSCDIHHGPRVEDPFWRKKLFQCFNFPGAPTFD